MKWNNGTESLSEFTSKDEMEHDSEDTKSRVESTLIKAGMNHVNA